MKKVLLIDNYDSFVYNLANSIAIAGAEPTVVRNDKIDLEGIDGEYDGIVISPGPGHPSIKMDFGMCPEVIDRYSGRIPIIGICLGMQGIAYHFGADVSRAPKAMHGKTSTVKHDDNELFNGISSPFIAGRYHSLCVSEDGLPECFRVIARSEDGTIMGIGHRDMMLMGLQFHPESVLTQDGQVIVNNFVRMLGDVDDSK